MPSLPYVGDNNQSQKLATPALLVDVGGNYVEPGAKRAYTLASSGALTNATNVTGGDYIWACEASAWNGATALLEYLGQDGTTWRPVRNSANTANVTMTANGQIGIGVGQGSTMRVTLTGGTPTAFYSNLAGL